MKILIVNTSDIRGGAARAAYRLHRALLDAGVDSQMLVQSKSSDDYTVIGSKTKKEFIINKMRNTLDALPLKFYKKTKTPFSINWLPFSNIVDKINKINSDVVHLHWINAGMLKIEDLKKHNIGKYENMNLETRYELSEYFKPYNEELEELLEMKFDWK